ncbi:hypothetical protein GO730_23625 [Spirosoma sp. HMF3257]|uniref:Uncharacterized protein n=1 Tax=Spirosoma telluris TaxID=2183553 RepID=A0A327NR13_9BACT|nr:hypothetical protein [Spirosoma telluris]RAI76396.1 hypothetical protein HMF3257_23555 [Spirosoma telluris]
MKESLSFDEQDDRIVGLLDRIRHLNETIVYHQSFANKDLVAIREFSDRRDQYVKQLAELLEDVGVIVQLPTDRQQAA